MDMKYATGEEFMAGAAANQTEAAGIPEDLQVAGDIWQKAAEVPRQEEPPLVGRMRKNYGYIAGMCLVFGVLFAFCRYQNPNGITWPVLVWGAMGIAYLLLKKVGVQVKKGTWVYAAGMTLLGISTTFTCSGFLIFFNMAGFLLLFLTGMMHQFYEDDKWKFPTFLKNMTIICFASIGHVFRPFSHGFAYLAEAKGNAVGEKRKTAAAVGLGILIAAGLLLVIFPTLLHSDMVFAGIFEDLIFEIEFGPAFVIFLMILTGFVASYAFFCALCSRRFEEKEKEGKSYNALIAITFTMVLGAVYALYAGIQVFYLFLRLGSLPEGVTYSFYARQGFFELLFVGILNFILVLACMALFQENKLLRGSLTVICGCTFIMIASAVYRMMLYVQTYHLTLLRILVLWFLTILALIMGGVTVSIYRKNFPMFRYIVLVVGCGYILLSFARPDRLIAEYNLRHWESVSVWDVQYILYGLSDDAAPVIAKMDGRKIAEDDKSSGEEEFGPACRFGWDTTVEQEVRNYFYDIVDRYKNISVRELNLAKVQARDAAVRWIEKDKD